MRTDKEIMKQILDTAKMDKRILAAYLKGSRTNPNVPKDVYRDFDIMYVVSETESFRKDTGWMDAFGKVILSQEQDERFGYGDRFGLRGRYEESYSWLLIFEDGSRIDVGVETVDTMNNGRNRNKLFLPLLDKIGCLPRIPEPTDEEFYVKKPEKEDFEGCCNEFYWSLCDIEKGMARDELPFAMAVYFERAHAMLNVMLGWYIGSRTDYGVSCGKFNKYFKRYLPELFYSIYKETFPDGRYETLRTAIENSCRLFRESAELTADATGMRYPSEYEAGYRKYRDIIRMTSAGQEEDGI